MCHHQGSMNPGFSNWINVLARAHTRVQQFQCWARVVALAKVCECIRADSCLCWCCWPAASGYSNIVQALLDLSVFTNDHHGDGGACIRWGWKRDAKHITPRTDKCAMLLHRHTGSMLQQLPSSTKQSILWVTIPVDRANNILLKRFRWEAFGSRKKDRTDQRDSRDRCLCCIIVYSVKITVTCVCVLCSSRGCILRYSSVNTYCPHYPERCSFPLNGQQRTNLDFSEHLDEHTSTNKHPNLILKTSLFPCCPIHSWLIRWLSS